MKRTLIMLGAGLLSLQVMAAPTSHQTFTPNHPWWNFKNFSTAKQFTTNSEKASYAIGFQMGQNFKNQDLTVNPSAIFAGLRAGLAGQQGFFSKAEVKASLMKFQQQVQETFKKRAANNAQHSQSFLTKNKTRTCIKTLASG